MSPFKFEPKVGMITLDSYLHGIGDNEHICCKGVIEHVGTNYFILRVEDKEHPLFITSNSYWCIEKQDFNTNNPFQ